MPFSLRMVICDRYRYCAWEATNEDHVSPEATHTSFGNVYLSKVLGRYNYFVDLEYAQWCLQKVSRRLVVSQRQQRT